MKRGVLLAAHGAPERVEDVERYLENVRGGRPASPAVLAEVRQRYTEIGGCSPLLRWSRVQAQALEALLGIPVFLGMRNWHPFLREAMEEVRDAGIERLAAIAMAPQFADASVGFYQRRTEEARRDSGATAELVWSTSFHDEPLLIEAFADRLRQVAAGRKVLFTAHSLPERALAQGDPYVRECRATAGAVAARLGIAEWDFAFQSQGLDGGQWVGPTVESCLDEYAAKGLKELVLHPIGFVCDHVEVLYDVDIMFRGYAAQRGIALVRPESLNDSPIFTAALAAVARRLL